MLRFLDCLAQPFQTKPFPETVRLSSTLISESSRTSALLTAGSSHTNSTYYIWQTIYPDHLPQCLPVLQYYILVGTTSRYCNYKLVPGTQYIAAPAGSRAPCGGRTHRCRPFAGATENRPHAAAATPRHRYGAFWNAPNCPAQPPSGCSAPRQPPNDPPPSWRRAAPSRTSPSATAAPPAAAAANFDR
eukprot:COSAG02_NODE_6356_length_3627_cov_54.021259_6_plen_188_part_00